MRTNPRAGCLAVMALLAVVLAQAPDELGVFVAFSDFHLDPHYATAMGLPGCTNASLEQLGVYGCDSPLALVNSVISQAASVAPRPDFILVLGDSVRHRADELADVCHTALWVQLTSKESSTASIQIQAQITSLLSAAFPDSPLHMHSIAETIGNNDVLPDYSLSHQPNSSDLDRILAAWNGTLSSEEIATIQRGGFYARPVAPGLVLISLNTIVYSTKLSPEIDDDASFSDPLGQFSWLSNMLEEAQSKGSGVIIIGHIPPILDSYARAPMWNAQYAIQYQTLVTRYSGVVRGQLFGHLHNDEFRCMQGAAVPLLIFGAVSPIYGNNPSFRTVTYSRSTGVIQDICVYSIDLVRPDSWSLEYCVKDYYNVTSISYDSFHSLALSMSDEQEVFQKILKAYKANSPSPPAPYSQLSWSCLYATFSHDEYEDCLFSAPSPSSAPMMSSKETPFFVLLIVSVVGGLAVLLAVVWVSRVFYRRYVAATPQATYSYSELEQDFDESVDDLDFVPRLKMKLPAGIKA